MRVHKSQPDVKGKIVLDMDISYQGNADMEVSFIGISGGVNGIVMKGRMRVELFLMDWLPLLGGMVVYFHFMFVSLRLILGCIPKLSLIPCLEVP